MTREERMKRLAEEIMRTISTPANHNRMWGRSSMTTYSNPAREVEFVCDE